MKRCLPLLCLLLCACDKGQEEAVPQTPQDMYEHAQALLKPNVKGQQSDFKGALEWTLKAAEGGHLQAQLDMGGIYLNGGRGQRPDMAKAYHWFSRAAGQGSLQAEVFVGMLLYDGQGVQRDQAAALQHWRKAADGGIAEAQFRLGRVLAQSPDTAAEGVALLEQAARPNERGGVPQAATALGNIYFQGRSGVAKDVERAVEWYARGAAAGDPMAQHVYALMLLSGAPVPQDTERGLSMLRLAAGQDYLPAMQLLIQLLRNGPDAAAHESEAEAWNKRLTELQNRGSQGAFAEKSDKK